MINDVELNAIAASLDDAPACLERAWRYWEALGGSRSGGELVRAFRIAALASPEGAAAFAQAYVQLHAVSGEGPRPFFVDPELRCALACAIPSLSENDRRAVEWVLGCASDPR
jgi:hypothetical protein